MDARPFSLSIMSFMTCLLCTGSQAAAPGSAPLANVTAVRVSGTPNAYQFEVEVASRDLGCHQYADWWEVLTADGQLIYRRILAHSHVDEQPFSRSGGPVKIEPDNVVWVRAHMYPGGYEGQVMKGTAKAGFKVVTIDAGFAADVARQPPQPEECAF